MARSLGRDSPDVTTFSHHRRDQRKRTAPDWFPGPFSRDAMERKGQSGSLLPAPRWCSFTGRSLTNESPDRDEIGGGHA